MTDDTMTNREVTLPRLLATTDYRTTVDLQGGRVLIRLGSNGTFTGDVATTRGASVTKISAESEVEVIDQAIKALDARAEANAAKRAKVQAKASETKPVVHAWTIDQRNMVVKVIHRGVHSTTHEVLVVWPNGTGGKLHPNRVYATEAAARSVLEAEQAVVRARAERDAIGVQPVQVRSVYAKPGIDPDVYEAGYDPATHTWTASVGGRNHTAETLRKLSDVVTLDALRAAGLAYAVIRTYASESERYRVVTAEEWVAGGRLSAQVLVSDYAEGSRWIAADEAYGDAQDHARRLATLARFDLQAEQAEQVRA